MKTLRALPPVALCLMLACLSATGVRDPAGGGGFERFLDGRAAYGGRSLAAGPDGGFLALGDRDHDDGMGRDLVLAALGAGGEVAWERRYGGPGDESAACLVPLADGGHLLVGQVRVPALRGAARAGAGGGISSVAAGAVGGGIAAGTVPRTEADGLAVRLDAAGEVVWSETYGGPGYDAFYAAAVHGDGFVLAGWRGVNEGDLWLLRVDGQGAEDWSRAYGGDGVDWAADVAVTPAGAIAVAGTFDRTTGPGDMRRGKIWALLADAAGDTLWSRTFGSETIIHQGTAVILDGEARVVVAGQGEPPQQSYTFSSRLMALDMAGGLLWSRDWLGDGNAQAQAVALVPGGGFLVSGSTYVEIYAGRAFLLRTDDEGLPVADARFDPPAGPYLTGNGVLVDGPGSCVVAGTHMLAIGAPWTEWWLRRLALPAAP